MDASAQHQSASPSFPHDSATSGLGAFPHGLVYVRTGAGRSREVRNSGDGQISDYHEWFAAHGERQDQRDRRPIQPG